MTPPTRLELIVQAAWFVGCMAAPVVIYFLVVGFGRLCERLARRGRRVA